MTRISIIAGTIPTDEIRGRAAGVQAAPFFNPLLMTEGEAYLTLMRNQALTLAQYDPESRLARQAVAMADNALHTGIHGYLPYMGAVDRALYPIARAIEIFKTRRQPASMPRFSPSMGSASWLDESLIAGEIKDPEEFALWWIRVDRAWLTSKYGKNLSVNAIRNLVDLMKGGKAPVSKEVGNRYLEFAAKYDTLKYIIDLYNRTIDKFAHHPLYNFLPQSNEYPASVVTKNILHAAGVQACAATGEFSVENMALWTRNGILQANIKGNVGALSPERTAFALTNLPDDAFAAFLGQTSNSSSKKGKINGDAIGILPAVALAIIAVIGTAVTAAAQMYSAAQQRKAAAFSGVQGWGTTAYAANQADWKGYQQNGGMPPTTDNGTNWPLILGAGAGLFLLTQK